MAEDGLDVPDVGPVLVHQRCHRVAQQMAGSGLACVRGGDAAFDDGGQMVAAERLTLRCEEHGHIVRLDGELGTRLLDVLAQPRHRPRSDGDVAIFAALALIDQQQAAVEREVVELQPHDFQPPHSGRVDHL